MNRQRMAATYLLKSRFGTKECYHPLDMAEACEELERFDRLMEAWRIWRGELAAGEHEQILEDLYAMGQLDP